MDLTLKIIHKKSNRVVQISTLLEGDTFNIGRNPAFCDVTEILKIIKKDHKISGKHMVIENDASEIRIRDLGSRNGTVVQGNKYRDQTAVIPFASLDENQLFVEVGDFFGFQIEWVDCPNEEPVNEVDNPSANTVENEFTVTGDTELEPQDPKSATTSDSYEDFLPEEIAQPKTKGPEKDSLNLDHDSGLDDIGVWTEDGW